MKSLFHQAEEIFYSALERPREEIEPFIAAAADGNRELEQLVRSLLQQSEGAEEFFDSKMRSVFGASSASTLQREGERIGAYRLDRLIGSGGMGSVYLASRVDGEFHQQAAIKVVNNQVASSWEQERLRYERNVLAKLKHVNIAGLLDGGSTATGHPYMVMEYVEGQPILEHCRQRKLDTRARLQLFLGVCDAVAFAHRNLVVHRDLKPSNIVVTESGVPKLLDFGISKLLDPLHMHELDESRTAMLVMTPAYASPEQVRRQVITTQTDVYSLGVVLYELLAGRCPFETKGLSPADVERLICDSDPSKPSESGHPELKGDLDSIVAMAMRKEPELRYAGVDQLAADVRRFLDNLPLVAGQHEILYRTRKFARRHKGAVFAGAAIVAVVLIGAAVALWYATQLARQVALMERQFGHFREISRKLLLEFPDRIQNAKNVAEIRRLYVQESLEYIDKLGADAPADRKLAREVARAYQVIGDVQGFVNPSSLASPEEALATYRKGIQLLLPLEQRGPLQSQEAMLLARLHCGVANVLDLARGSGGSPSEIRRYYAECLRYAARTFELAPSYLFLISRAYTYLGDFEWREGNRDAAIEAYRANISALARHKSRLKPEYHQFFAIAEIQQGRVKAAAGDDWGAHAAFQQALTLARAGNSLDYRYAELATLVDLVKHARLLWNKYHQGPDAGALANRTRVLAAELNTPALFHPEKKSLLLTASQTR